MVKACCYIFEITKKEETKKSVPILDDDVVSKKRRIIYVKPSKAKQRPIDGMNALKHDKMEDGFG